MGNTLPSASHLLPKRSGNTLPRRSNKLPWMGKERNKRPAEDVLAENFARLRDKRQDDGLWKGPGVSPKTANNVANGRHNTKLDTIVRLAKALGVEPYLMLIPLEDVKVLAVLEAWAQSDDSGRDTLFVIADAMLKRGQSDAQPDATALNRKRDRSA